MGGQHDLPQVVRALAPSSRFAGSLNRRKQQGHENADDRDYDQQLDEREASTGGR
jgi:hypothetical protein